MSDILFSVPIKDIKQMAIKQMANEFELSQPPILHLPCEHEGDMPYFYAYEINYRNKHYVFVKRVSMIGITNGEHIDVVGYKYYCPEDGTYKVFENTYEMKRYYKFVIYKYFE